MPLIKQNLAVHPDAGAIIHRQIEAICRRVEVHAPRPARGEVVRRQAAPGEPLPQLKSIALSLRMSAGCPEGLLDAKYSPRQPVTMTTGVGEAVGGTAVGQGVAVGEGGMGWASQSVAAGTASAEAAVQWGSTSARAAPRSQWPSRWASGFLWQAARRSCETAPRPAGAPSRRWPRPVQSATRTRAGYPGR